MHIQVDVLEDMWTCGRARTHRGDVPMQKAGRVDLAIHTDRKAKTAGTGGRVDVPVQTGGTCQYKRLDVWWDVTRHLAISLTLNSET